MITLIKHLFHRQHADSLARYYQSRLEQASTAIEREAITYTQSLIPLYRQEESNNNTEAKNED